MQPARKWQRQVQKRLAAVGARMLTIYKDLVWYEIYWPEDLLTQNVSNLVLALSGLDSSYSLRFVVRAKKNSIRHFVGIPAQHKQVICSLINSFLSAAELSECTAPDTNSQLVAKLQMTTRHRVAAIDNPELTNHAILSALQSAGRKENITLMWILGRRQSPETITSHDAPGFTLNSVFMTLLTAFAHPPYNLDRQAQTSFQNKHASPAFRSSLMVGVTASNYARQQQLLHYVAGALKTAEAPGVRLGVTIVHRPERFRSSLTPIWRWPLLINTKELVGMLGWPLGPQAVPGLSRITSRRLNIPANMPRSGRVIATSSLKDSHRQIRLSAEDGLMHMHVMGPTGVGKSTLLLNLITQDIKDGRGVVVVDPKGGLVSEVLKHIPSRRYNDVVILDPSDVVRPVGLNPLARSGQPSSLVVDDILSIFRKLYGSYFGPRTEDILHAGLLTLMTADNPSLCVLPLLYTNPTLRQQLVSRLNDPLGLGSFWSWYETISHQERNAALAPVMNKLRAFLLRPSMRQVIGQVAPRFDIADALSGNKILLVNLAKGSLGSEASQLFGSFIMSQVWQAIQSRATLPASKRPLAFVYVDEVQDYLQLPTDIADVLVQARSYNVGLILAHQHLGQLSKDLKSALFTNARTRVCFQLAKDDASVMAKNSSLLSNEDFENLSRFHVYARVVIKGRVSSWMSGKTLAPIKPISNPELLRKQSQQHYGRDAAEVEEGLFASLTPSIATMAVTNHRKRRDKSETAVA